MTTEDLLKIIERCAIQFRYYEEQHNAKGPSGEVKARVNAEMAEMCEEALSRTIRGE